MKKDDDVTLKGLFLPLTTKKTVIFMTLIGFFVFFNALFGHFVWDDVGYILSNPKVHVVNLSFLFGANNSFNAAGYYRPISATYFAIIYSIFGNQPFFFHLIQISIHIINSILIYILFKRFFKEKLSLFLSIIFLIHPINVESVAYIGASQSVILIFFGLLAILINLQPIPRFRKITILFLLLLLTLLTKETGVLFVLVIFCYQWLFKRKETIIYLILSFITVTTYLCIRFFVGNIYLFKIPFIPMARLSFAQRLESIPAIILYYFKTLSFPKDLIIEQQWVVTSSTLFNFYLPIVIILVLSCLLLFLGTKLYRSDKLRFKQLVFFSCWFVSGILFLIQLFPLDMTVADRWFYFPFIGLLGVIGIIVTRFVKLKKYRNIISVLGLAIIILLSTRTIIRNNDWHDDLTLLEHDTKIETNFDKENNLGLALSQAGDMRQALIHFQKSALLEPFELNLTNIGGTYLKLNKPELGKSYLEQALLAKRYSSFDHKHELSVYVNYATYLTFYDLPKKAAQFTKIALQDYPSSGKLYYLLAIAEYLQKNNEQSLIDIQKALVLNPTPQANYVYNQIYNNLPLVINNQAK